MKSGAFATFFVAFLVVMGVFMIAAAYDGNDDNGADGVDYELLYIEEGVITIEWLGGNTYKVTTYVGSSYWRLYEDDSSSITHIAKLLAGGEELELSENMYYLALSSNWYFIDPVLIKAGRSDDMRMG